MLRPCAAAMKETSNNLHYYLRLVSNRNSQVSLGCSSLFVLAAFSCIVAATAVCNFIEIKGRNVDTGETESLTRGIWEGMSTVDSTCGGYSGVYQDAKWNAAKATSILSCAMGGFAVVPLVCACGKKLLMSQVVSMSGTCMWACLCSGLTFLMLGSDSACQTVEGLTDNECRLDVGGNLAIAATALFFVSAITINCAFMAAVMAQDLEAQQEAEAGG
jgi:hypothetical protein